jgi:hypothetical protein
MGGWCVQSDEDKIGGKRWMIGPASPGLAAEPRSAAGRAPARRHRNRVTPGVTVTTGLATAGISY